MYTDVRVRMIFLISCFFVMILAASNTFTLTASTQYAYWKNGRYSPTLAGTLYNFLFLIGIIRFDSRCWIGGLINGRLPDLVHYGGKRVSFICSSNFGNLAGNSHSALLA